VTFLVDNRQSNLSVLKTSGLDGSLSYSMKIGNGTLNGALQATHVIDYAYTLGPATPITSFKNQVGQVLDWKFRGALGWSTPQTSSSFTVNYAPAYSDVTLATAPRPIDSFTTVDLHFTYRPADNGWLLRDTSLNLTIQNLLDRDPPFVNTALGYDALNGGSPFGRTAVISLRKGF
jgi:outer membrane receptor protein involved in Fe transport